MNRTKGFTLIELLVSIAIIIASATIVVAIISATFRSSNKTTSVDQVRQSGNNALNQISKMIQFADDFQSAFDGAHDVSFCPVTEEEYEKIALVVNGVTREIACGENTLTLDGKSLFDNNNVLLSSCSLTCSQRRYSESPVIGVSFDLSRLGTLTESNVSESFSKKIKMRNINQ